LPKRVDKTGRATIIFTKVPEKGYVKTRLTQNTNLTLDDTARIAKAMLMDTITLVTHSSSNILFLGYHPQRKKEILTDIISSLEIELKSAMKIQLIPQSGNSFEERFSSVVKKVFEFEYYSTVIIGSDLPYVSPNLIDDAFIHLEKKTESQNLVIGPAGGGGIYLVGITKQFDPNYFVNYHLFSEGVEISKFTTLCRELQINLSLFPPLIDVDIEEDLVFMLAFIDALLIVHDSNYYHFPKYTSQVLSELQIQIKQDSDETRRRTIEKKKL
jgi:glycosyltransferase A (GT-A) superfamily protein (DUF2064 family)